MIPLGTCFMDGSRNIGRPRPVRRRLRISIGCTSTAHLAANDFSAIPRSKQIIAIRISRLVYQDSILLKSTELYDGIRLSCYQEPPYFVHAGYASLRIG
jgi:hypothetical protein